MAIEIDVDELKLYRPDLDEAKTQRMIVDAVARAAVIAPCIVEDSLEGHHLEAASAIIKQAILRWMDVGNGAITAETAGPFSQTIDTRPARTGTFWPSEIRELRRLCKQSSGAFQISTAPDSGVRHAPFCDLMFGGVSCSCGANLTGAGPLHGVDD